MALRLCLLAVVAIGSWSGGCATCCAPFDDYYPMVGGRWVRDNPTCGRVGSAFEPAGHKVEEVAATTATEPVPANPVEAGSPIRPRRDGASYLPTDE
jgi:hypothetical protein